MLQQGDLVPHFDVRALDGNLVRYATIWQRKNLLLVTLPDSETSRHYASQLTAHTADFNQHQTACVITRDSVAGIPSPGVLVADRWGEIAHVVGDSDVARLPQPLALLEWIEYLQSQCPECQGEAK